MRPAHATAAAVARSLEEAAGDLAVSLDAGCAAVVGKLAMIVLVDCHRRLTLLSDRMERAPL
jgi:hypothetical protein